MLSLPPSDHPAGNPQLELLPKVLNALFKWKWLIVATVFAVAIPVALVTTIPTPQTPRVSSTSKGVTVV